MTDPRRSSQREHAVMAYYDRLAPVYGDGEYFRARRAAVLTALSAEIAGVRAVLDLGCGNGAYLTELFRARNAAARPVGVDLSPHMLQATRQRLGEHLPLVRAVADDETRAAS